MKEQYLKALDLFDSENTRFWSRYNLFTGLQILIIAGFAANYKDLIKFKFIAILLVFAAIAFSCFTILVTWRSLQINRGIYKSILEIEKKDDSLMLLETYMRNCKSPLGTIVRYCVALSGFMLFFWLTFLVSMLISWVL